jgi:beta-lactamase class A
VPAVFWMAHPSRHSTAVNAATLQRPAATAQSIHAAAPAGTVIPSHVTPEAMSELQAQLQEAVSHAPARMAAVYVKDIGSGLTAAANPNREFLAASLIKLPVMGTTYARWEHHPEQKTALARRWVEWMITVSDNASTDRLIDLVDGPERVTRFCTERGWSRLQVRHAILNHRGRGGRNTCTAREMAELLAKLDRGRLVSAKADEEMWQVLCRSRKLHRIPAGVPRVPGVQVGNKTGTLGNVLHDAAIVRTPRTHYAICILLSGQSGEESGNAFCREVSRLVFDTLHGPVDAPQSIAKNG